MDKAVVAQVYSGAVFRYRRDKVLGMSANELGSEIGVTGNSITRYETGVRTPTAYEVVCMAHKLGIPLADILAKVDKPKDFRALLALENLRYKRDGTSPVAE